MELLFLLSLHVFLIVCYYIRIESHHSRLNHGYLLFALFFPFVGELCLLVAELGEAPAEHGFVKPFKQFDREENVSGENAMDIPVDCEITRSYLLNVIKEQPQNITLILKEAMKSSDVEVVHIAAASIMKRQRLYEEEIRCASEAYKAMPNNLGSLKKYIIAIEKYYNEGLLSGAAAVSLLEQQELLLSTYVEKLPNDRSMHIYLVQNYLKQEKYDSAVEEAEKLHYSDVADVELCGLLLETYYHADALDKVYALLRDTQKISTHWSSKDQEYWKRKQRGYELCVVTGN